jgi:excisionase family DNA binding protein
MAARTYTTAEAAAKIGISRQTLYAWIEERKIAAPKPTRMGQRTVRFWTNADIEHAISFKRTTIRRGPKPKAK